jgi:AcrR family transcriptional regulator
VTVGRKRSRQGFGPDDVVEAAMAVLDEVGLEGFTMRAVADQLGTYPATLYWHVGGRGDLLSAIVDRVLSDMSVPDAETMHWTDWLRAMAREYRRVLHAHPNVGGIVSTELVVGQTALVLTETVLQVLQSAGFQGTQLAAAHNVIVGSVVGWVSVELSSRPADLDEEWTDRFAASLRELPATQFPAITGNLDAVNGRVIGLRYRGGAEDPLDNAFEMALDTWVGGLALQLQRTRPGD